MEKKQTTEGAVSAWHAATRPSYDELVQSIYDSALNPDHWNRTLDQVRVHLNASAINLIGLDMAVFDNPFLYTSNRPTDHGMSYKEYWFERDLWVQGAVRKNLAVGGKTLTGNMLVDKRELLGSEFYNDWLIPQDIKDVLSTNLWGSEARCGRKPDSPRMVLCFFRNPTSEDFQGDEYRKLQRLAQHLNRAFQIAIRFGLLERGSALKESVINTLHQAVILLDEQRRILQANPAAQLLLRTRPDMVKVRNGRVTALGIKTSPDMETAFDLAERGIPANLAFARLRPDGRSEVASARIVRLSEIAAFGLPSPNARYLLVIDPASDINENALSAFCGLFKLSRAEQAILRALMADATPEEIAERQGTSLNTIRTHLKNIRGKTGVHRMAELIRMALAATREL